MIEIHADDFCITPGASRDIIDCINEGAVNGISIMADSPYLTECMEILKEECRKPVRRSVHLDLITGKALTGVSPLTDGEGYFNTSYMKYILISFLPFYGIKYRKYIKAELSAQIERCFPYMDSEGIRIDSHRHIHMVPLVFSLVMEIIREKGYKLSYIRITKDDPGLYSDLPGFDGFRVFGVIKSLLLTLFSYIDLYCFGEELKGRTADFASIIFSGKMTERNMIRILHRRSAGSSGRNGDMEIMVHPFQVRDPDELSSIHDPEDREYSVSSLREKEIKAVKSPGVAKILKGMKQI